MADPAQVMPGDGEIVAAATQWARGRFAAPRKFERLITGVDVRDEIIERVATCIERRDLREERVATGERRLTRPRVELAAIDPFAYTAEALKADSEHVSHCTSCGASGRMMCPPCRGTGNGRCPTCHGSGKQTSAKTGRPIQCKSCRATGSAPCRICAGAGSIHCNACLGSGHQLTWLTIASREHWSLYVPEHSSFVIAHPALRAPRAVQRQELSDATLLGEHSATCPLDVHALPEADRALVAAQLAPVDLRFERVRFQQYVKLAALRRDVTYEMCGTRATLSLSGNSLTPATTPAALRPIRRRLWLWIALCFAVACVGELAGKAMLGASPYYQDAIGSVSALACVALVASIPLFGTLLRAWRGGLQFGPVRRLTAVWAAGTVGALIAIPIVAFAARPSVAEIDAALVRHDLPRARAVLDAYKEVAAARGDLAGAQGRVVRAEAEQRRGQALDRAQQLLAAHQPREALAAIDRDFAGDRAPEVAEARARAHDGLAADCTTPACRLDEARQANAAQPTAARGDAVRAARGDALQALDPRRVAAAPLATRLQQLAALGAAGAAIATLAADDAELAAAAKAARELAATQRAAVPLLGHDVAVAEALLGAATRRADGIAEIDLDARTRVFLVFDRAGACTGVYAVGRDGPRSIEAAAAAVLSQAVGKPSPIAKPASADDSARWYAAGWPVVARRASGDVVELRVGDAAP